ncbi:MAG TPA: phosphatase PAP2 family protein [Candidatus Dormibacteraeota bacterium]|nr:phosphatase PAP2 family protein [Candidatus Dormibacteraeota bacterium]
MSLRAELRRGVYGIGWKGAAFCIALGVADYITSLGYEALNHGPYRLFLRSPMDQALPVVPIFVVPYVSLQPFIYGSLVIFLLFRARIFQSAVLSMIVTFLVSYVFFAFLQTYVERPVLTGGDALTRMIRDVYAGDHPFNDFPSLHVSLSAIIAIHWWRFSRRFGPVPAIWAALIAMSTVLVRQHYLADVAGGLILAFGTSLFFLRLLDHEPGGAQAIPSSRRAA